MGYAVKNQTLLTIDMGHFHPTENVADKLSSVLMFVPEVLLHLSRGVRWDSDHVTLYNDDMRLMCQEMVRTGQLEKFHIGTDNFDGSINRIGAWTVGSRSTQKSLLFALLEPHAQLKKYEEDGNYFARMSLSEQVKTMPLSIVWEEYCKECNVPSDAQALEAVLDYEKTVLAKRS